VPGVARATFSDTRAGVEEFATWLRPHWKRLKSTPHSPVFCVVGGEFLPFEHDSVVTLRVQMSQPPMSDFEPFSTSVRLISKFEQANGINRRSMEDAVQLCTGQQ
jgi:hypothetical protein